MANEGSIHFIRWVTSPSSDRNRDAKQTPPSSVSQTSEFMQLWWISQLHRIASIPFKDVRPIKTIKYGVMVLQICAFSWFFNEFKFIFCEVFFCYFSRFQWHNKVSRDLCKNCLKSINVTIFEKINVKSCE